MAYTALKPCRFSGRDYMVGESVPDEEIRPGAAVDLVKMQVIAPQAADVLEAVKEESETKAIGIAVPDEEGGTEWLPLTQDDLQNVFDVLIGTTAQAEPIISKMDNSCALHLLNLADARKSVKQAAKDRAKELYPEPNEGEE